MIIYKTGNIFESKAQVLTNPVNCYGVMGKGLALELKKQFPDMFLDYQEHCFKKEVLVSKPCLWISENIQILVFATKRHWRDQSDLDDIRMGLEFLAKNYDQMGISSIAVPPLGCGLGGLDWRDVKNLIEEILGSIHDLDVFVYEPLKISSVEQQNIAEVGFDNSFYKIDDGVAAGRVETQIELF